MKYIQQAYTGKPDKWKYLIPALGFFGLVILNYIAIKVFDIDYEETIKEQIEAVGSNRVLFENLIIFAFFLGALFLWVKYVHKQSITSLTTSRKSIDWNRIFFSFFIWGAITVIIILAGYYFDPESVLWNFKAEKFFYLLLISVLLIPFQTSFEEFFMRGYLMQGIGIMTKSCLIPLVFTSIVFGLLHLGNPEVNKLGAIVMVYYIGTGFFLGIITLMDEGLELALGFHAANNLVTALLVTADWSAFQTDSLFKDVSEPSVGAEILFPVLILYPIVLLIFSKKYGWTHWKERLTGNVFKPVETDEDRFIA